MLLTKGSTGKLTTFFMVQNIYDNNNCAGCPQGRPPQVYGRVSIYFFFVVGSNLHINLHIKLCSLLEGIYYNSDCLQQKRPNQNPLSAHIL